MQKETPSTSAVCLTKTNQPTNQASKQASKQGQFASFVYTVTHVTNQSQPGSLRHSRPVLWSPSGHGREVRRARPSWHRRPAKCSPGEAINWDLMESNMLCTIYYLYIV